MNNPASAIDHLVTRARQLHSLPSVAMEVLKLTENPQVDARAIKACIEKDPALTTKVLRVVNSSLFGLGSRVSDLNQALALLGIKPLKMLVLGFSLPTGLFDSVTAEILAWYWRRTLTKAVAGRQISETVWNQPGDDSFVAGLLQDLGMLLLIQQLGDPYVRLLQKIRNGGGDLIALESQSMGFDHTMLTARLLEHWGLPNALVNAVDWHANEQNLQTAPALEHVLPRILHLTELIARLLVDGQPDVLGELLATGRQYCGLSEQQLEQLVNELEEKVQQLADVLSLRLPDGLDYRDVLAQAHGQLADVAASVAEEMISGEATQVATRTEGESLLDELRALSEAVSEVSRRAVEPVGWCPTAATVPSSPPTDPGPEGTSGSPAATVQSPPTDSRPKSATTTAEPGLRDQVAVAVAACRHSHCPLSLLLVELHHAGQSPTTGEVAGLGSLKRLESACRSVDHSCAICLPQGEIGFAIVLPNCDRPSAVGFGNQLIDQMCRSPQGGPPVSRRAARISVGVATVTLPPKNFPPEDLLDSADHCLYGSHASGGGVVKSIEIY